MHGNARATRLAWALLVAALVTGSDTEHTSTSSTISSTSTPSSRIDTLSYSRTAQSLDPSSTRSIDTCASASINYITHRPSQCWKQPRFPTSGSSITLVGTESPSTQTSAEESSTSANVATPSASTIDPAALSSPGRLPIDTTRVTILATTSIIHADALPSTIPFVAVEAVPPNELETESPLDNAKFLSFEDWKKQNLPQGRAQEGRIWPTDRQPRVRPGLDNTLDSLGDDGEIELDFSGFGGSVTSGQPPTSTSDRVSSGETSGIATGKDNSGPRKRSKDAGKTCKERSNYASFDCGASVLKTNPQGKKASSVLVENKDSYMLNECSADNKFIIVELCDEIKIDTIVLANFEFFSSIFKTFRVSVSDRYPVKIEKWKDIGVFEARNTRELQAFLVEDHNGFARYVRIEFVNHYGSEFYCPVSLLRVHGVTAFEEYKLEQLVAEGQDIDEEEYEATLVAEKKVGEVLSQETQAGSKSAQETTEPKTSTPTDATVSHTSMPHELLAVTTNGSETSRNGSISITCGVGDIQANASTINADALIPVTMETEGDQLEIKSPTTSVGTNSDGKQSLSGLSTSTPLPLIARSEASASNEPPHRSSSSSATSLTTSSVYISTNSSGSSSTKTSINETAQSQTTIPTTSSIKSTASTLHPASQTPHSSAPAASAPGTTSNHPPTQESFFKSINKRLQFLEANSTLSLQYIESQSALLRDAFSQVEKRQISKTSNFLDVLNATVAAELTRFQSEYEQLWQSTLMELASQRDEGRRERELLGERVRMLAEEMVSQKRLMAAQATILLLCLGLVIFARLGGMGGAIDSSLLQGMQEIVNRGKEYRVRENAKTRRSWRFESPWASPSRTRDSREATPPEEADDGHGDGSGLQTPRSFDHNVVEGRDFGDGCSSPLYNEFGETDEANAFGQRSVGLLTEESRIQTTQSAPTTPLVEVQTLLEVEAEVDEGANRVG